jgi:hypothetical protein
VRVNVEHYDLRGAFDGGTDRLTASVTVTSGKVVWPPRRVVLDCRADAVTGVRLESGKPLAFDGGAGALSIELGDWASRGVAFVVDPPPPRRLRH